MSSEMGDGSHKEVISQQETSGNGLTTKRLIIRWNNVKLPNMVTGITITTTQLVRNATLEKVQMVITMCVS